MHRRRLLGAWAAALGAPIAARVTLPFGAALSAPLGAWAQSGGPVRVVTPTPVGVGSDLFARAYAEQLARLLKAPVIVENRPGAAGTLGADAVAKAQPNGATLLFTTSLPFTTNPWLFARLPYDARKDFVPVAQLYRGGSFIVAGPAFQGRGTLPDLIEAARRAPDTISYASYGPGSTAHLGMEVLQDAAGIQLVHVPYRQSAMPDVIGGQVALGFEPPISAIPNVRAGKVKALAYTGERRSAALPDVPTVAETLPGVDVYTWVGVWVPAGTPEAIVEALHGHFNAISQDPALARLMADNGVEPLLTTRAQMAAHVARESEAMGRLIRAKHIVVN
jgi:tripartite-type tricarboxylate transporter receptor subunit TctC